MVIALFRTCIIVVECKEGSKVSLLVSYVTSSASWSPSYDIRMYTAEDMLKVPVLSMKTCHTTSLNSFHHAFHLVLSGW